MHSLPSERNGMLEQQKRKDETLTTTKTALVQQQQHLNEQQQQVDVSFTPFSTLYFSLSPQLEQELSSLHSEHDQIMAEHAVLSNALLAVTGEVNSSDRSGGLTSSLCSSTRD